MFPRPVFVRAVAVHLSWADRAVNLQELIFAAAYEALQDSAIGFAQLDSVVLAAHDLVDGRSLSSMVSAPAAGAYLRDEIRLGDDGAAAVAAAAMRVGAGLSENCMVAAWGRASEGDPERIANALFDPFFSRPFALTEVAVSAMRASVALREFAGYAADRDAAAARRERQVSYGAAGGAPRPPLAHPLREAELPRWRDVVAALVLTSEPTDVRIGGAGLSSEPYWPGDRDLTHLAALQDAAGIALRAAERSIGDVGVLELDGLTLFDEALALEAVGAAGRGEGMTRLARADDAATEGAGGSALGYCAPAMGLVRVAEAVRRLRAPGAPGVALASGSSTVAAQTQAAIVLAGESPGGDSLGSSLANSRSARPEATPA